MYPHPFSRTSVASFLLASAALVPLSGAPARAACDPASPNSGDTVVCTGTSAGIQDSSLDDLTITVESGATVDGAGTRGFQLNDGVTITNNGTITSTGNRGIQAEDDATITNNGLISAPSDRGIHVDDDAVITNNGTITAGGDHAIQGDNNARVINSRTGVITSTSDDGINVDNDSYVENNGTINGADDGIQAGDDDTDPHTATVINNGLINADDDGINTAAEGTIATVVNNGTIKAGAEGVNANVDGAKVANNGTIVSGDDGINVATGATVINTGFIHVTGPQDGIDIDQGTVFNSGVILAEGGEDGIDFDIEGTGDSTVTNTGSITGNHAIYTDPADTKTEIVYNYGLLNGLSGVAVNLGQGDDTLVVGRGSRIIGTVELGDGNDTFAVESPVAAYIRFDSTPETITLNGNPAIVTADAIAIFDPAIFGATDAAAARLLADLTPALPDGGPMESHWWASSFGSFLKVDDDAANQGYGVGGGGFMVGYDHARDAGLSVGVLAGASLYRASLDDGWHDVDQTSVFAGLRMISRQSDRLTLYGAAIAGLADTDLDGDILASGSGDGTDGFVAFLGGLTYRMPGMTSRSDLEIDVDGGWLHRFAGSMDLSGYDGATVGSRDADIVFASLEIGMPFELDSGGGRDRLTPFARVAATGGTADDFAISALGGSTGFSPANGYRTVTFGLGAEFSHDFDNGMRMTARLETAVSVDSDYAISGGLRFALPSGR
jgi:hypothetical protein